MIEAVIAVALLATAGVAVARLSQNAAVLNQQSDDRVALVMAVENTLGRLRTLSIEDLQTKTKEVASAISESTGCNVTVDIDEFSGKNGTGFHLVVSAVDKHNQRVALHDWRLVESDGRETEPEQPDADETKETPDES